MAEWLNALDLKSRVGQKLTVGSNPTFPAKSTKTKASVAQLDRASTF